MHCVGTAGYIQDVQALSASTVSLRLGLTLPVMTRINPWRISKRFVRNAESLWIRGVRTDAIGPASCACCDLPRLSRPRCRTLPCRQTPRSGASCTVFRDQPGGKRIVVVTEPGRRTELQPDIYAKRSRLTRELMRYGGLGSLAASFRFSVTIASRCSPVPGCCRARLRATPRRRQFRGDSMPAPSFLAKPDAPRDAGHGLTLRAALAQAASGWR